jgi:hypothetical protein
MTYKKRRRILRKLPRNFEDPKYKTWRSAVYKRDKFQCQWPGCINKKGLNAHHIRRWADCPSLRYDVNNGITLCIMHHKQIQGKEDYYALSFLKILESRIRRNV